MIPWMVLVISGVLAGASPLDNLQTCKNTKVEENVTLRGGLGAGTFKKLAKVTSMASCLELCCKNPTCDVAFLSGLKCYGVECVSDDECESTATDTSETKVLIAHVRTGKKKGNKSFALAGIPKHNTMANKPLIGNPKASKTLAEALSSQTATGKTSTPAVPVNINPGMAGQCKPGVEHKEVTLKGGINAGTYKDIGAVASMDECSKKCCSYAPCDLAFMLQGRCYLVGCTDGKNCQLQKAKTSPYHPSVMYVARWNNEGVKHAINVQDETTSNFMCSPMKLMTKVTLKGGLKSGDFTDTGKVGNIGECYDLCCQQPTCNLAFMLGQNCFSVKCFNKDLCSTIPAQPSIYNPQIAYVWNRKELPGEKKAKIPATKKTEVPKPAPKCPKGKIIDRVTLIGGLNAGNFHDNGKVKDIQQCRRICCEMPKCNLAFMLGVNCFSVECKNAAVCKTQPARPSQFFPKISYVRAFGSTSFMTSDNFDIISASAPAAKSNTPAVPVPKPAEVPKPLIPGLPGSLPGSTNKPALPVISPASIQQASQPTSSQAIPGLPQQPVIPGLPVQPSHTLEAALIKPSVEPAQPSQTLEAAFNKPSVEPDLGSNLNALPVQPKLPGANPPGQLEQLMPQPSSDLQNTLLGQSPAIPLPDIKQGQNPLLPPPADDQQQQTPKNMEPPVLPSPSQALEMATSQIPAPAAPAQLGPLGQLSTPEQMKPAIPANPADGVAQGINLTSISDAEPGQAMKMNIVDGKLQLTPVGGSKESNKHPQNNATSSAGAFDAILGGSDESNDKCMATKIINDVTLKGGKKAGKFKDQGDVKNMKACKKLCCKDDKCNLAFMLEKTCYTVTCKNKDLCNHTPAPPSDFRPRISYVRPMEDSKTEPKDLPTIPKDPDNLRCQHSNISNSKDFEGGIGSDNFTMKHEVIDMPACMARCCEDKKCDVAYYVDEKCYSVTCSSKDACKPVAIGNRAKNKIPLISAMVSKPKEEEDVVTDFESKSSSSPDVTDLLATKQRCQSNRISTGITLRNGNRASNFTEMGEVESLKKCIALCCIRPACDIAYLENTKCFAVKCNDGVMCQTNAHQADIGTNVKLAYMDRHRGITKERDWMIVYVIVGSLAFAAVIGGVVWGVCICSKRNKIAKQRRLLDDDDEDDEMLPKPTQTRYRTPMHRY